MLKLVGALLVITACGLLGNDVARGYAHRPQLLRSLQTSLQFVETEINYGATPLPEALEKVARAGNPELAPFFLEVREQLLSPLGISIQEAWEKGLDNLNRYTVLEPRELELLAPLGAILGASDREDQVKHLRLTLQQLKQAEVRAREEGSRNERMWRYLGFLFGLMLVLTFY